MKLKIKKFQNGGLTSQQKEEAFWRGNLVIQGKDGIESPYDLPEVVVSVPRIKKETPPPIQEKEQGKNAFYQFREKYPKAALAYDGLNLALAFNPVTAPIAMGMSALSAGAGLHDMYQNGFSKDNVIDVVSGIPGAGILGKFSKAKALKSLTNAGKSAKYIRRCPKYKTGTFAQYEGSVFSKPLTSYLTDPKYGGYARWTIGQDVVSKATDAFGINDGINNYNENTK